MNLLHIDSSILGQNSATRELGAAVVADWQRRNLGSTVQHLDLAREPLEHLSGELFSARAGATPPVSAALAADLARSERVLADFLAADVVVIGAPMYNFSIPSQLKAWIDRIAVAGKTFRYTDKGPEGLVKNKKIVVISSRGGVYSSGPAASFDHQESYLRSVFAFIGVTDVEFIRAEALNMGADKRAESMDAAHRTIEAPLPLAA